MLRVIAALFVLGLGAIAWVLLLPEASKKPQLASATPVTSAAAATGAEPETPLPSRDIRVVYPGPDGAAAVRKLSDKVVAGASVIPVSAPVAPEPAAVVASAAPATATEAPAASVNPGPTVATAAPETSVAAPAPTNVQALNINTATVDALNQIPGGGRIGRTIASHRPYRSVEDLLNKRVVRKSVYDKIKDQIAAN